MKTEVYSWRLEREMKTQLEREARLRKTSVSALLDLAVHELLKNRADANGDEEQRRLQQAAMKCVVHSRVTTLIGRRRRGRRFDSVCVLAMRGDALIDTGAILALLDRTDRWHSLCVEAFHQLRLPLLTSEAVLTNCFT